VHVCGEDQDAVSSHALRPSNPTEKQAASPSSEAASHERQQLAESARRLRSPKAALLFEPVDHGGQLTGGGFERTVTASSCP